MMLSLDKQHGNRIEFTAEGIDISFANILRRYCMSRVLVLAIDKVTFYDNNSSFWDEYLAHRIGLMPILTPAKLAKDVEVVFTLDAEGPKTVYSSEFKSSDDKIKMALDKIVVATLGQNQKLRLEAKAVLSDGTRHAKFQSGLVSYSQGKNPETFKFVVEMFYHMEPADVVLRGVGIIEDELESISKDLGGSSSKKKKEK